MGAGTDTRHALHYVAKSVGGRGKRGGLSEYAEKVGRHAGLLTEYRDAARVAETVHSSEQLLDKAAASKTNRGAVEVALREYPDLSDRAIAEVCAVSDMLVGKMRKQVQTDCTSSAPRTGRDTAARFSGRGRDGL